jgi:predicted aminopeptidase
LIQFRTYNAGEAALDALFRACGGSFPRLLAALRRLGPDDFSEPQQEDLAPVLLPLARGGCR